MDHIIVPRGISHMHYAGDTMIMVEGLVLDIINLELPLLYFEVMSGLKINFVKSEVEVISYPQQSNT